MDGSTARPWRVALNLREDKCIFKRVIEKNFSKCKSSVIGNGRSCNPITGAGHLAPPGWLHINLNGDSNRDAYDDAVRTNFRPPNLAPMKMSA